MQDPATHKGHHRETDGFVPRLTESGRALLRMAKFTGLTTYHASRAIGRGALSGGDPVPSALDEAHIWAGRLARVFGIDAVVNTPLPPPGSLVVANHRSYIDLCATMSLFPLSFTAKAELEKWPLMGWAARAGGTVFVDRSSPESRDRTRTVIRERLDRGLSMVVFPEGTTFEGPGLLEFRPGVFRLAVEGGFPIVPAAIWYEDMENAWVGDDTFVGHFLRVFRKPVIRVNVAYGPPMTDPDPEILRDRAWSWIRETLKN